jgi:pimeloyl-ACP methyl ester carboxylesterase
MIDFQTHFVFPTHAVPAAGRLPAGVEELEIKAPDRAILRGVHFPPDAPSDVLILGFGGNAWNGQDVGAYLHQLFPQHHVVAFHYRGYRPSTGTPSAEALIADAPLVYDAAVARLKPKRVYAVGLSIGSGVAAELSARRRLDGVILVTPFDSLKAVAQGFMPWLPIAPFFSHEIDAAAALEKSAAPTAIVAGAADDIIAPERSRALAKRVADLRFDRTIRGAGHNDIYARSAFHEAMREALAALGG